MPASVYVNAIQFLPVGADLLPYLVYSASYHEVIRFLNSLCREERHRLIVFLDQPPFTENGVC